MSLQRNKFYLLLILACLAGYVWLFIAGTTMGIGKHEISICMFKHVTNIPCPSCGSTRSALSLLKGNFSEAMFWNPIGIILLIIMLVVPVWIISDLVRQKDTLYVFYSKAEGFLRRKEIAIPAILLLLTNWIWNIYKGV